MADKEITGLATNILLELGDTLQGQTLLKPSHLGMLLATLSETVANPFAPTLTGVLNRANTVRLATFYQMRTGYQRLLLEKKKDTRVFTNLCARLLR